MAMYFFSTWYLSIIMKFISLINYLYDIRIDEIKAHCIVVVLFNPKTLYYIHNLLWHLLRNFLKTTSFHIEIKTNIKPLKINCNQLK